MSVRNCSEIGENLVLIFKRLLANDRLVKLLYYNDKDPLNNPNLSEEEKISKVYGTLIKPVPRIGPKDTANSLVTIRIVKGNLNLENSEFRDINIAVEVFVPLTQWIIKDENMRPFLIMGEIQKSLDDKSINGIGKMYLQSFELNFLTEEIGAYEMQFMVTQYD